MKKLITLLTALTAALMLCACSFEVEQIETSVPSTEAPAEPTAELEIPEPTEALETAEPEYIYPDEDTQPAFSIEPAIERFAAQRPDRIIFSDGCDSEYMQKVAVFPLENVTELAFCKIRVDIDDEGRLICTESEDMAGLDSFTTDDILVLEMVFEGDLPTRALRYTDSEGRTLLFGLGISGEDGALMLIPIAHR